MLEIEENFQVSQEAKSAKTFGIGDPRPLAKKYPYTHGLPKKECLDAIGMGDSIHVWLHRPDETVGKEAWFEVLSVTPDYIEARIKKTAYGWPDPTSDVVLRVPKWAVAAVKFAEPKDQPLAELPQEKYRDWCLMDSAIRLSGCKVQHIFREEPKILDEDDPSYDTGWRLSAASNPLWDTQVDFRPLSFALDCDDSWLNYINEPVGSAFKRDQKTGLFLPDQAPRRSFTREMSEEWWDQL